MMQNLESKSYKKVKLLHKGYASKVYLISLVDKAEGDENKNPNTTNKTSKLKVLKKYFKKKNESTDISCLTEYKIAQQCNPAYVLQFDNIFLEDRGYKQNICLMADFLAPLSAFCGQLSSMEIDFCLLQLLNGLQDIHSLGYIHRDIKPNNLFISQDGQVKIGDFGISRLKSDQMTPNTTTKNYRAPEVFFGLKSYDSSIDLWSLGCTIYELATGKLLFEGKSEIEILTNITNLVGPIDITSWRISKDLTSYLEFQQTDPKNLESFFANDRMSIQTQKMMKNLIEPNPDKRGSIIEVILYSIPVEVIINRPSRVSQFFDEIKVSNMDLELNNKNMIGMK